MAKNNFFIIDQVVHNENLDKFESGNVVLELNNFKTSEMKGSINFYQILQNFGMIEVALNQKCFQKLKLDQCTLNMMVMQKVLKNL